jgi:hypothetical protein
LALFSLSCILLFFLFPFFFLFLSASLPSIPPCLLPPPFNMCTFLPHAALPQGPCRGRWWVSFFCAGRIERLEMTDGRAGSPGYTWCPGRGRLCRRLGHPRNGCAGCAWGVCSNGRWRTSTNPCGKVGRLRGICDGGRSWLGWGLFFLFWLLLSFFLFFSFFFFSSYISWVFFFFVCVVPSHTNIFLAQCTNKKREKVLCMFLSGFSGDFHQV